MQSFLARQGSEIKGVLSGFDRVRFRGTIRWLSSWQGMMSYLGTVRVPLKGFKEWAMGLTSQIKQATQDLAERAARPLIHLPSSSESKEARALEVEASDRITEGLICVLSCTEMCRTFEVGPNRALQKLELRAKPGKCLHYYFYLRHREYGLMHLRLQTWLPLTIHVCLNGREWLAQRLLARGIPFVQRDNCFVDVADVRRAQRLLNQQLRTDWEKQLNGLVRQVHPAHPRLFPQVLDYYWSAEETEWATDVMFRSPAALAQIYPHLVRHAMTTFGSGDVMRFLGRRTTATVHGNFTGEVVTSLKTRPEGMRVKHALNHNSVKMYDKQGSVLRVETTINDPRDMKAYRTKENEPQGPKHWRRLRKGVSDLHRRTEVSQKCNARYLEALAAVDTPTSLQEVVGTVCEPVQWQGRRVRALAPLGQADGALLAAVVRGEFAINGFRNRDLRPLLCGDASNDPAVVKRQAARITRQLRLLRGHALIQKVPKTHRYQLTTHGRTTITALLIAKQTNVQQLAQLAA